MFLSRLNFGRSLTELTSDSIISLEIPALEHCEYVFLYWSLIYSSNPFTLNTIWNWSIYSLIINNLSNTGTIDMSSALDRYTTQHPLPINFTHGLHGPRRMRGSF